METIVTTKDRLRPSVIDLPSAFKSPKGEAQYMSAYEATMQLWTVPYEAIDIPSRFGKTHVIACGPTDAPPLVLLHCFSTSLTVWAYNIADLSKNYRAYAVDMMGQPSKSIPDQPIHNREEMVEWLSGIIDALKINETDLIGYSYGGFAALNYAMRAPNRVKKLILLSPAAGFVPLRLQFYIYGIMTGLPFLGGFMMKRFLHWMFYESNFKDERNQRMFYCMLAQMSLGVKHFRMGVIVPPIAYKDEELRSVKSPTLLLIGQQEAIYNPVAAVNRAKKLIPNIKAELIPQAAHDLPVTKAEIVDQKVLNFLEQG